MEDHRTVNRENWDERVPAHLDSPDYATGRFAEDPSFLSQVVRFDVSRLGDIRGLRGVHLQCHIGTDTVSGEGTYVATDVVFQHNVTHTWNHGLGEIITALMDAGVRLTALTEHDSIPWQAFPGRMEQIGGGEWRLADRPWRLAHSYTLQAIKQD